MNIGHLLDQLPTGVLVDHTSPDQDSPQVHAVRFYDGQQLETRTTALLLALPELDDPRTVRGLDPLHPAALLVLPHSVDAQALEELRRTWEHRGDPVPVIARKSRWVDWGELFSLMNRTLQAESEQPDRPVHESLSALADHVAAASGASITIEDLHSRVLAYSSTDSTVDSLRADTILQRAIPRWRVQQLMADGFLPAIWRAEDVVERQNDDGAPDRLVMPIKSGGATVGTVWAAPGDGTDGDRLRDLLRDAAAAAAPLVHREQLTMTMEAQVLHQALRSLFKGEGHLRAAAGLLGIPTSGRYAVMAYRPFHQRPDELQTLEFHLGAALPGFHSTVLDAPTGGGQDRVLLAEVDDESTELLAARVQKHLARTLPSQTSLRAVVCSGLSRLEEIPPATRAAQLGLTSLQLNPEQAEQHLTILPRSAVDDSVELLRVVTSAAVDSESLRLPVDRLALQDRRHGSQLLPTLRAALAHPGNHSAAARSLNIHSNSLRYRLGRVKEVSGIQLDNRFSRLRAGLALLLHDLS